MTMVSGHVCAPPPKPAEAEGPRQDGDCGGEGRGGPLPCWAGKLGGS